MIEDDEQGYRPTEGQLERRERLTGLVRQAMGYSDDLVPAVAVLQDAALVSVDVTRGDATDVDLKASAERCLQQLERYVNVHPMRQALRKVIAQLESELDVQAGDWVGPEEGQANEVPAADGSRKERAG